MKWLIPVLLLAGCQFVVPNLPTVADVCALPPALRGPQLERIGSTEADMAVACLLLDK